MGKTKHNKHKSKLPLAWPKNLNGPTEFLLGFVAAGVAGFILANVFKEQIYNLFMSFTSGF